MIEEKQYGFKSFEIDSSAFKLAVEPTELRLGNWLQSYIIWNDGFGNVSKKVIAPFRTDIETLEMLSSSQALLCTMEPIPLTHEILEKCGFVRHFNSNEFWNHWQLVENGWHVSEWLQNHKAAGFEEKGTCYWSDQFIPVKYLHRLQNLYHELTNKELEISL